MARTPHALSPSRRLAEAFAADPNENVWLNAVRTLAIVLVLLRHGQRVFDMGAEVTFLEALKINGWAGVDLFFVLSGYLVTAGLTRTFARTGRLNVTDYALRRARRIVPAYVFVLVLVVAGYFPLFAVSGQDLAARVAYHLVFLQDVFPSDINVVFWSLGVEAKFYALIPFAVLAILRVKGWRVLLAIGLAAVLAGPALRGAIWAGGDFADYPAFWRALRSPFYACIEPFALGALIAIVESRGGLRMGPRAATLLFAAALGALVLYLGSHEMLARIGLWDATVQPLVLALIFACLVIAAIGMKPVRTRFEPAFRFGARVSYALYLVHFPLIPLSLALAVEYGLGAPGFWAIYVATSLVHAVAILAYVERPFMAPARRAPRPTPVRA